MKVNMHRTWGRDQFLPARSVWQNKPNESVNDSSEAISKMKDLPAKVDNPEMEAKTQLDNAQMRMMEVIIDGLTEEQAGVLLKNLGREQFIKPGAFAALDLIKDHKAFNGGVFSGLDASEVMDALSKIPYLAEKGRYKRFWAEEDDEDRYNEE